MAHRSGSRVQPGRSTVYVLGELEPQERAMFYAEEIRIDPRRRLGATVEILGHGIAYWSPDRSTARAPATVRHGEAFLHLMVAAYALLGGTAFNLRLRNWIESRDVVSQANVIGFRSPRFENVNLWGESAPENRAMRDAALIARGSVRRPLHRLALRDFHGAAIRMDEDSLVYAYRAVEAIRQSIVPGKGSASDWAAMHRRLGTSRPDTIQLARAADLVRHAKQGDARVLAAMRSKRLAWLLSVARDALLREFELLAGRTFQRL